MSDIGNKYMVVDLGGKYINIYPLLYDSCDLKCKLLRRRHVIFFEISKDYTKKMKFPF